MPSKRMKPNLGDDCPRENALHVDQKSKKKSHLSACSAIDIYGDIVTPSNASVHEVDIVTSSLSLSMSTDGKRISSADPAIDQMIFSPLFDHDQFDDTISSCIIEGSYLPYMPDNITGASNAWDDHHNDLNFIDYDLTLDEPDNFMVLPFLDRTMDDDVHLSLHPMDDDTWHFPCIEDCPYPDMKILSDDCRDLSEASSMWAVFLPKEIRRKKNVTMVLDLDETLVHSSLEHSPDADFTFPVSFNAKSHTVYVRQRPHLHEFLHKVSNMFQIIVFTASQSIYAEHLLDILDPHKTIISRRLYRESCLFHDDVYTKDLSILGIDLAKVFIIDNSPQVFRLQVNNGIPIKSWFDDPSDHALLSLLPFLETLVDVDDVRPIISERFNKE